jgi:hypothetical protein
MGGYVIMAPKIKTKTQKYESNNTKIAFLLLATQRNFSLLQNEKKFLRL